MFFDPYKKKKIKIAIFVGVIVLEIVLSCKKIGPFLGNWIKCSNDLNTYRDMSMTCDLNFDLIRPCAKFSQVNK